MVMRKLFPVILVLVLVFFGICPTFGAETKVKALTFITAKPGGTWFVLTSGFAGVFSKVLGGVNVRIEATTGGSQQNTQIVGMNDADFGLGTNRDSYEAFNGIEYHKGRPAPDLRAIFWLSTYVAIDQMVVRANVPAKSFSDMDGRTFNAGVAGGMPDFLIRSRSKILGINPKVQNMTITDAVDRLKDGLLDGMLHSGGLPVPALLDLFTTHSDKVKFIGYTDQEAEKILAAQPGFFRYEIPANSYKGQTEVVRTLADSNMMNANKNVPDDIVYTFVKAVFTDTAGVKAIHPQAGPLNMQDIVRSSIPIHPGAIKYYEENGIKIPDRLRPKT